MWAAIIPIVQAILSQSHNEGAQKAANLMGMFNSAKSLKKNPPKDPLKDPEKNS